MAFSNTRTTEYMCTRVWNRSQIIIHVLTDCIYLWYLCTHLIMIKIPGNYTLYEKIENFIPFFDKYKCTHLLCYMYWINHLN